MNKIKNVFQGKTTCRIICVLLASVITCLIGLYSAIKIERTVEEINTFHYNTENISINSESDVIDYMDMIDKVDISEIISYDKRMNDSNLALLKDLSGVEECPLSALGVDSLERLKNVCEYNTFFITVDGGKIPFMYFTGDSVLVNTYLIYPDNYKTIDMSLTILISKIRNENGDLLDRDFEKKFEKGLSENIPIIKRAYVNWNIDYSYSRSDSLEDFLFLNLTISLVLFTIFYFIFNKVYIVLFKVKNKENTKIYVGLVCIFIIKVFIDFLPIFNRPFMVVSPDGLVIMGQCLFVFYMLMIIGLLCPVIKYRVRYGGVK